MKTACCSKLKWELHAHSSARDILAILHETIRSKSFSDPATPPARPHCPDGCPAVKGSLAAHNARP